VSVIGLVDPPYQGRHFGRPYTHVGITIIDGGQINFLEENEDRYRRGSGKLGLETQLINAFFHLPEAVALVLLPPPPHLSPHWYLPSLQTLAFSRN
jgi:hypothetical protein